MVISPFREEFITVQGVMGNIIAGEHMLHRTIRNNDF